MGLNTLSIFLYLADVVANLQAVLIFGSLIMFMGLITISIINNSLTGLRYLTTLFVALIVATLIPSKNTIYMIAASEVGQTIVESEEGLDLYSDLKKLLKQQISED